MYDHPVEIFNSHVILSGMVVEDEHILPYNKETRHLHGTVGEFTEVTKWVPKKGEPILVRDFDHERWTLRIFMGMYNGRFMAASEPEALNYPTPWEQAKPYINPFKE